MKPFLLRTAIALLVALGLHALFGLFADGRTDEYYLRFTTPRQRSLVIGTSRAAQGLHPDVLNAEQAALGFDGPLFNYGFTIAHSPFGPTYLHAIAEKLDTSARHGLYLVTVDPWALSAVPDSLVGEAWPESERTLGTQWCFNGRPNYEYLVRHWPAGWGALARWPKGDPDTTTVLLPDGRLEMHIPMDSTTVRVRTRRRIDAYAQEMLPGRRMSDARLAYLDRTIDLLAPHGRVVLIQLPVSGALFRIEQQLCPDFSERMSAVAARHGLRYFDLMPMGDSLTYPDGNHLDGPSGEAVSRRIAALLAAEP